MWIDPNLPPDQLGPSLRLPEVKRETGLSKATIYRKIKAGEFPKPVPLSDNAVGWFQGWIILWKANQLRLGVSKGVSGHGPQHGVV